MQRLMLDTVVFNRLLDGQLSCEKFGAHQVFVTHVQRDELARTKNLERREALLAVFRAVPAECLIAKSAVWDDSRWDESSWSGAAGMYEAMLKRLQELDSQRKKKVRPLNQSRDVRIAETAILNDCILVTDDESLRVLITEFCGAAISTDRL